MDEFIKIEGRKTKMVINNNTGTLKQLEVEPKIPNKEMQPVEIVFNTSSREADINGILLSKMQTDMLVQFLTQKG